MKSEVWSVERLKLWDKNPRAITKEGFERLKKQLTKFPIYKPLIITPQGEILGGNMRFRALLDLGHKEVWVSIVEPKSEADKFEISLSDNDRAGYYDDDMVAEQAYAFKDEICFEDYSIDYKEPILLSDLVDNYAPDNKQDDEVPEVLAEAKSKLGDIYILGEHRLMCGDSTKKEDVEKLMDGVKADMVFTDPPYGVSYGDKNKFLNTIDRGNRIQTPIENDHMNEDDTNEFWLKFFSLIKNYLADVHSYYIFSPQIQGMMMMMMMMMKAGMPYRHVLIWVKNNHVLGRTDYNYKHEPMLYGWTKEGTHRFYGKGKQVFSVWNYDKPHKSDLHPTMKPVELIINALQNSSKKDDIVLDSFGGSGSTLIACEKLNRKCYMMELDPIYCDVIVERWEKYTGKKAVLTNQSSSI